MQTSTFTIKSVLGTAWHLVKGSKWAIWLPSLAIAATSVSVQFILHSILKIDPNYPPTFFEFLLLPLITNIMIAPFFAGAFMVAIRRARGEKINKTTGYRYFSRTGSLMLILALITIFSNTLLYVANQSHVIVFFQGHNHLLQMAAGIISALVCVFFILSIPLVADKQERPFQALAHSAKLIKPRWFRVSMILLVGYVLMLIAMLPTLIGLLTHPLIIALGLIIFVVILIWLLPFLFLLEGVIYHRLVDEQQVNTAD